MPEIPLEFTPALVSRLVRLADEERALDMNLIRQLATCWWVAEHHNVVVTGATGTGKTFLGTVAAGASHDVDRLGAVELDPAETRHCVQTLIHYFLLERA